MTLADSGYASEETLRELERRALPACVALGREHKRQRFVDKVLNPATARMAERLQTPEGRAHYRRRKCIPEPVFGWIKQVLCMTRAQARTRRAALTPPALHRRIDDQPHAVEILPANVASSPPSTRKNFYRPRS